MNTLTNEDIKDIENQKTCRTCMINGWSKDKVEALKKINPKCIFWYESTHDKNAAIVISKRHKDGRKEIIHIDDIILEQITDEDLISRRIKSLSRFYPDEKMCTYKNFEYTITIKPFEPFGPNDALQQIIITDYYIIISNHMNGMTTSAKINRRKMKVFTTNHGFRISSDNSSFEFYTDDIFKDDPLGTVYARLYRLITAICPSLSSEECYEKWHDDYDSANSRWYDEEDYFELDI